MSKTTVKLVEAVNGLIEATMKECASTKKKSTAIEKLEGLKTSLSQTIEHLKENEKRKFIGVRKGLRAIFNIVDGSIEGLSSGDLTRREFQATLNTLRTRFYPNVCSSLSSEIEKAEAAENTGIVLTEEQEALKAELAESADWKDALGVVQKTIKKIEDQKATLTVEQEEVKKVLESLDTYRSKLPLNLKADFQVVRMPVLPIFSNYNMNSEATFKKLGIKYVPVEGYAILMDQLLIAVSVKRCAKAGMEPLEYAQSAVALINERASTTYEFVTDEPRNNPRNSDIKLFWILPKPKMSALMRVALTGSKASTVQWGLPFSS